MASTSELLTNVWALHVRWPKYSSFSFRISPYNDYSGLIWEVLQFFFRRNTTSKSFNISLYPWVQKTRRTPVFPESTLRPFCDHQWPSSEQGLIPLAGRNLRVIKEWGMNEGERERDRILKQKKEEKRGSMDLNSKSSVPFLASKM